MEEQDVRERAEGLCAALVAGDIDQATQDFSKELRQNLGEVIALLPLPANDASVVSIERGGSGGFTVVVRIAGEIDEVLIQTRWKDRDGHTTVVEASHLSRTAAVARDDGAEDTTGDEDQEAGAT
jgi:hypothetical protein